MPNENFLALPGRLLSNRDYQLPPDGMIHLVPKGEFPHPSGVLQVIDQAACERMVKNFSTEACAANFPGVLIDFDHFSHSPDKPSEAAGWITRTESRPDGVWGAVRWSNKGKAAVEGGEYRLVSPVFSGKDMESVAGSATNKRPARLARLALTNDPNMKGMTPISNRAETPAGSVPNQNQNQTKRMTKIASKLGLAGDASEDAILASLETVLNHSKEIETANGALTKENQSLLGAEFDTKYANRIKPEARDQIRAQFLANRASTLLVLDSLAAPEAPARPSGNHLNRAAAQGGPAKPGAGMSPRELTALVSNRAKSDGVTFDLAWASLQAEKPELFTIQT